MKTGTLKVVTALALLGLSACTQSQLTEHGLRTQAVEIGTVSQHARGLMPPRQDLSRVVRGQDDKCYYTMMDGTPQGYLSPVLNPFHEGDPVCDPVVKSN
jgi:hypothetical protein